MNWPCASKSRPERKSSARGLSFIECGAAAPVWPDHRSNWPPRRAIHGGRCQASLELWADINVCTGLQLPSTNTAKLQPVRQRRGDCALLVTSVDHTPYGNSLNFDVAGAAWSLFERQPMK